MNLGDVTIRDERGLHRGTPIPKDEPRPVYYRRHRWLFQVESFDELIRA